MMIYQIFHIEENPWRERYNLYCSHCQEVKGSGGVLFCHGSIGGVVPLPYHGFTRCRVGNLIPVCPSSSPHDPSVECTQWTSTHVFALRQGQTHSQVRNTFVGLVSIRTKTKCVKKGFMTDPSNPYWCPLLLIPGKDDVFLNQPFDTVWLWLGSASQCHTV